MCICRGYDERPFVLAMVSIPAGIIAGALHYPLERSGIPHWTVMPTSMVGGIAAAVMLLLFVFGLLTAAQRFKVWYKGHCAD